MRSFDDKIEFRIRVTHSANSTGTEQTIIGLNNVPAFGTFFWLRLDTLAGNFFRTELLFKSEGSSKSIGLSGNERIQNNTWYTVRITYDLFRSEFDIKATLDNGTKIFDHDLPFIDPGFADIFSVDSLFLFLFNRVNTNGIFSEFLTDFIDASFKEKEWTQTTTPVDSDWLSDSVAGVIVNDDVSEFSEYEIVIPNLDSISGELAAEIDNTANFAAGDSFLTFIRIFGVDGDDGGLHEIMRITLDQDDDGVGSKTSTISFALGGVFAASTGNVAVANDIISCDFSISLSNDRSKVNMEAVSTDNVGTDKQWAFDRLVSTDTTDPSQEFVIKIRYQVAFTGNVEYIAKLNGFTQTERDIFSDLFLPVAQGVLDIVFGIITSVLITIGRFWAVIQRIVGDIIVAGITLALGILEAALTVAIALVEVAIETMEAALEVAIALVEVAIEALEPFLTLIGDAINALWTLFITSAFDILEAILITLLTLLSEAIDFITELVFFAWDALSFPDVLAWVGGTLARIVEFVNWVGTTIPQVIQWFFDNAIFIFVIWWIGCIPVQFAREKFNPLGGLASAVDFYFNNAVPISIFGNEVYVPQGVIFTFWALAILPADFILFTALP